MTEFIMLRFRSVPNLSFWVGFIRCQPIQKPLKPHLPLYNYMYLKQGVIIWQGPQVWVCSTLTKGERVWAYSRSLKVADYNVVDLLFVGTPRVWLITILSIEVFPLHLDQRYENSNLFLLFQRDWQEVPGTDFLQDTWSISCIMLMKFLPHSLPFGVGYISMWKIITDNFSIHRISLP